MGRALAGEAARLYERLGNVEGAHRARLTDLALAGDHVSQGVASLLEQR